MEAYEGYLALARIYTRGLSASPELLQNFNVEKARFGYGENDCSEPGANDGPCS